MFSGYLSACLLSWLQTWLQNPECWGCRLQVRGTASSTGCRERSTPTFTRGRRGKAEKRRESRRRGRRPGAQTGGREGGEEGVQQVAELPLAHHLHHGGGRCWGNSPTLRSPQKATAVTKNRNPGGSALKVTSSHLTARGASGGGRRCRIDPWWIQGPGRFGDLSDLGSGRRQGRRMAPGSTGARAEHPGRGVPGWSRVVGRSGARGAGGGGS